MHWMMTVECVCRFFAKVLQFNLLLQRYSLKHPSCSLSYRALTVLQVIVRHTLNVRTTRLKIAQLIDQIFQSPFVIVVVPRESNPYFVDSSNFLQKQVYALF